MSKFPIDLAYLVGDWVEAILWGVYSVLFCVCMRCIWIRRRTELVHFTTVMIIIMYLCATVHLSLSLRRLIEGFVIYRDEEDPKLYFGNMSIQLNVAKDFFYAWMMVLGDSIIVWRCFIVWNRNFWIVSLPLLMLAATTVGGLGSASEYALHAKPVMANKWAEGMFITSLITNVSVTCLTAGRIWHRGRGLSSSGKGNYTPVILLVIESALVMSVVKSVEFALWLVTIKSPPGVGAQVYVLFEPVVQVEGIVPASMILAVTLGYTSRNSYAVETTPTIAFRPRNVTDTSVSGTDAFHMDDLGTLHNSGKNQERNTPSGQESGVESIV